VAERDGQAPSALPLPSFGGRNARFETLAMPPMAVSSTEIRQRVALGQPVSPLVGEAVARYIEQHLLYRASPGP
jgi:nicotinate-nucleotide adenylyltransferase